VFYEPVWIFANGQLAGARDLAGKRISMGRAGSGSRKLGMELGQAVGLAVAEKDLVDLAQDEVPAALLDGRLDVAVIVAPWESPHLRELLADARVNALSFPRADAHVALRPYLSKVVVPQGVADLRTNRPPQDLVLVAPKTSLIVRKDLHPALQYLLLEAATQAHSGPGIFQKAGQFPSAEPIDVPLTEEARQFYRTGPPFLQRYMPFWMAVFVGRLLVILIPVVGVLLPLLRLAPVVYGWYVRRRIFRLYGELKFLEAELDASAAGFDAQSRLERLDRLEARANKLRVSTMFSQFLYTLRAHIELVRGRLEKRLRASRKDDSP
jgi:hypothetical protein